MRVEGSQIVLEDGLHPEATQIKEVLGLKSPAVAEAIVAEARDFCPQTNCNLTIDTQATADVIPMPGDGFQPDYDIEKPTLTQTVSCTCGGECHGRVEQATETLASIYGKSFEAHEKALKLSHGAAIGFYEEAEVIKATAEAEAARVEAQGRKTARDVQANVFAAVKRILPGFVEADV